MLPFIPPTSNTIYNINLPNIFSAYLTLPIEHQNTPSHAYPIVDNKKETLTQSQMLRDPDMAAFIKSQPKEGQGLLDMDVFDIHHISTKLTDARNLSSI